MEKGRSEGIRHSHKQEAKMMSFREQLSKCNCSIWKCTDRTIDECLKKLLFGEASNSPRLKEVTLPKRGDLCFLLNLNKGELWGVFIAESDIGEFDRDAWKEQRGYPFKQIRVRPLGKVTPIRFGSLREAFEKLEECGVRMGPTKQYEKTIRHFVHPPEVTRKILEFFPHEAFRKPHLARENEEGRFFVPVGEGLDQVAGLKPIKRFIRERMIEPFKYPKLRSVYRLRVGGGILLFGPPGTGKTLIAKATAGELEAAFLEISPSVICGFPGDAEQRLEKLFEEARRKPRVVIFIDEAEALLCKRELQTSTVMQRVVPVLLSLFSKVSQDNLPILIIAATNRPEVIDEAFLRPGRLDVQLLVGLPDLEARVEIIRMNLKGRPNKFDDDENLIRQLAGKLDGWTGADIKNLLDKAALECYRRCPKPQTDEDEVPEDSLVRITPEIVNSLVDKMNPSVRTEDYQRYIEWNQRFGTQVLEE
jgi:hypothetical protein